jgi:hypothetical protein
MVSSLWVGDDALLFSRLAASRILRPLTPAVERLWRRGVYSTALAANVVKGRA